VIRRPARAGGRVADQPEPTNSLQPGPQAERQVPKPSISFTSPNAHPKTDTPGDPSQATVATTPPSPRTPYKGYKPNLSADQEAKLREIFAED
jgi:hypothetical protein